MLTLPRTSRIVVVAVCAGAIIANLIIVLHLAYLWSALKWEPETEWDEWRMNGVRVFVFLVAGYFAYVFLAALVGLLGALQVFLLYLFRTIVAHPSQRIPSFLRFFRDSAIVDIGFTITFTVVATICARRSATRALLCEQLSRQPQLLRNLANSGLNFENCEQWFEDVVLVFVLVMAVSILMRVRTTVLTRAPCSPFLTHPLQIQFTITLSNLYSRLVRKQRLDRMATALDCHPRRVLLLPPSEPADDAVLVYVPVPHTAGDALELGATEAWVSHTRRGDPTRVRTGQIRLPVTSDEGLLPNRSPVATAKRLA
jgi:hypothetical protein